MGFKWQICYLLLLISNPVNVWKVNRFYTEILKWFYHITGIITSISRLNNFCPSYYNSSGLFSRSTELYHTVYQLEGVLVSHLRLTISVRIRCHNMRFLVPYATTLAYQRFFFPVNIRIWNSLSKPVVSCPTLDSFKRKVQSIRLC